MKILLITAEGIATEIDVVEELVEARVPILIARPDCRIQMLNGTATKDIGFITYSYTSDLDGLPIYREVKNVDQKKSVKA